jgi:excinuclease ABC subunit A
MANEVFDPDVFPIVVRGAREHNLKNISLEIPAQKLVVITGPSGSGKSSLAFDTIFAEGQRRYMESLSAYARQFLEQLAKPNVDFIDGLSPSVAIEQKTIGSHPRSTVGTITSIYDYLRLLYSRRGEVRDPETGSLLKAHTTDDILEFLAATPAGEKVQLFASVVRGRKGEFLREFEQWRRAGFSKVRVDGKMHDLHDPILLSRHQHHDIDILLDVVVAGKTDFDSRTREAMGMADKFSEGWLKVTYVKSGEDRLFSRKVASPTSGQSFPDLEPRLFSFNSPYGMCPKCSGVGFVEGGPAKATSRASEKEDAEDDEIDDWESLVVCPKCQGARLRPEALCVYFEGQNIFDLSNKSCSELLEFFANLPVEKRKHPVTERVLDEIEARLKFLDNVGVAYLQLGRRAATLSGGEAQRIRLATQLGSQLSGVMYVLDEPSIGLHPRDQKKLLNSLKSLRDFGNSVLVVEHDEETMLEADWIIDIGPGAGKLGGEVIAQGTPASILKDTKSTTARYLNGLDAVSIQRARRPGSGKAIEITGCTGHNLKNVSLSLPLGKLIVFTGVSGSGKSSLVRDTLEAALLKKLYRSQKDPLPYQSVEGIDLIDKVVHVDQRAIGRSPRSNPATYTGIFSPLRATYAQTPDAQIRGYTPGTFSFNIKGGRCDACEGAGRIKVEMHFLADVYVPCETCYGSRYRREILEVRFKGKSIAEALQMTVDEACKHFENQPMLEPKLRTLQEVGLGYIHLGQAATTLSGGEAQRIKLARELSKRSTGKTLYFLDEPTTGLHFDDVKKLLELLQRLTDGGNTVVIIEHHLDVIAAADWIVDLGPGPGNEGGRIIFEGTPEQMAKKPGESFTGQFMQEHFKKRLWS